MSTANGTTPSFAEGAEVQLQALLDEEERELVDLRARVEEVNDRVRRLKRALAALTDQPKAKAPKRHPQESGQVKRAKIDQTLRAFRVLDGGPATASEIARATPNLSPQMARRTIMALRDEGRVRLVGKTRGGGRSYKLVDPVQIEPAVQIEQPLAANDG